MQVSRKYVVNLQILGPGSLFGEIDLIDDCPRQARAVCSMPTACLIINKTEFFEVFSKKDIEALRDMESIIIPTKEVIKNKLLEEISERNASVNVI